MKHDLSMKRIEEIVQKFNSKNLMIVKEDNFSPNDELQNKIFEKIKRDKDCKKFNHAILLTIGEFFPLINKNDLIDYADVILTYYQTIAVTVNLPVNNLLRGINSFKMKQPQFVMR